MEPMKTIHKRIYTLSFGTLKTCRYADVGMKLTFFAFGGRGNGGRDVNVGFDLFWNSHSSAILSTQASSRAILRPLIMSLPVDGGEDRTLRVFSFNIWSVMHDPQPPISAQSIHDIGASLSSPKIGRNVSRRSRPTLDHQTTILCVFRNCGYTRISRL